MGGRCDAENTHCQVGRTRVRSIDSVRSDLLRRRGAKRIVVLWIYHSWESPNRVIIIAPRGRGTLSLSLSVSLSLCLSLCLFEVGLSGIGQCSEVILVSLAIAHFQSLTCKKKLGRHSKSHPFPSPKHTHTHTHKDEQRGRRRGTHAHRSGRVASEILVNGIITIPRRKMFQE